MTCKNPAYERESKTVLVFGFRAVDLGFQVFVGGKYMD